MQIAAVQELTLLDYPEKLAAIIFTANCNMRCLYCHNSHFVLPNKIKKIESSFIPFKIVKNFLKIRKNKLEAVVISGGEPCLQKDLLEKVTEIKKLGYLVKIDTNGTKPDILQKLIKQELVDFIALDVKSSPKKAKLITGLEYSTEIKNSIKLLNKTNIKHEIRTTVLPEFHNLEELQTIAKMIKGCKKWVLQNFHNTSVLDEKYAHSVGFKPEKLENIKNQLTPLIKEIEIRI